MGIFKQKTKQEEPEINKPRNAVSSRGLYFCSIQVYLIKVKKPS